MAGEHSVLSPSKGEMILNCAAALGASKGIVDAPSKYAAEGTAYHDVSARVLLALQNEDKAGDCCDHYVGATIEADGFKFTIDEENAAHAQKYVDAVRKIPGTQFYEVKLDTSEVVGVEGQSGTGDCVTLDYENDTIHVDDLKFGMRVVFAKDNKQLLQYGAAALLKYAMLHDWKYLKVSIHQPRAGHYDTWTYGVEEIHEWIRVNQGRFQLAYALWEDPSKIQQSDYAPTEKGCEWCPIRGSCAARAQAHLKLFRIAEADAPPARLTDEQLGEARTLVDKLEAWASAIKQEAHHRAVVLGNMIPGWKVVQGRKGNRKWGDPKVAEHELLFPLLGNSAYKPREIVSPAEAEKLLKKAKHDPTEMAAYVTQPDGALSLVKDDSPKSTVAVPGLEFRIQEPVE